MRRFIILATIALTAVTAAAQGTAGAKERTSFYAGVGYTLRPQGGLTLLAGSAYAQHDLQLSFTLGLTKSDPVYWYDSNSIWQSTTKFKQHTFGLRYGYHLWQTEHFGFMPQLGYSLHLMSNSLEEGDRDISDKAKANTMTLGVRLTYRPVQHCTVFLAPEYGIRLSQDKYYRHTADISNCKADGVAVTAGVMVGF